MKPLPLPDASVAGAKLPDWRKGSDAPDPDDELLPSTPPDVVSMLGFDPLTLARSVEP